MDPGNLEAVPIFAELPEEARNAVAVWVNELSVSPGKTLVHEGDYSYDLFVIADGTAEVQRDGQSVAELTRGDVFGEMGVLEDQQRTATVVAKSPMRLLTLSHWDVDRLRKDAPEVVEQLNKVIEARRQ
ncbi:MAG: cyclic nucleotide-binding domain-containing protein [Thermoleophilaceae bacterium]